MATVLVCIYFSLDTYTKSMSFSAFQLTKSTVMLLIIGWIKNQHQINHNVHERLNQGYIYGLVYKWFWGKKLDSIKSIKNVHLLKIDAQNRTVTYKSKIIQRKMVAIKFANILEKNKIYNYEFKIQHMNDEYVIGVCTNNIDFNAGWFNTIDTGYGIDLDTGYCLTYVRVGSIIGDYKEYIPLDRQAPGHLPTHVQIRINRIKNYVSYWINGINMGIAYFVEDDSKYSIAIMMSSPQQTLTLLHNSILLSDDNDFTPREKKLFSLRYSWMKNENIEYSTKKPNPDCFVFVK